MAVIKKKTKKKSKGPALKLWTDAEYQELREMTVELANCAVIVLASGGKIGVGSGMVLNKKTGEVEHWTTRFFDALDDVGVCYNREAYFKGKKK